MLAVSQIGASLEFASPRLRANREIVMTSLQASGLAFQYASEDLKEDEAIINMALTSDIIICKVMTMSGRTCVLEWQDLADWTLADVSHLAAPVTVKGYLSRGSCFDTSAFPPLSSRGLKSLIPWVPDTCRCESLFFCPWVPGNVHDGIGTLKS